MPRVSLIERHEWGARPPARGGYRKHNPNRISVHQVAGMSAANWQGAKTIKAIQRYHQTAKPKGRGWPDGGYHVVLGPDGSAWRMNEYALRTYHAGVKEKGWDNNTGNVSVSLYGRYHEGDVMTQEIYDSLVNVLADICEQFDIDPMGTWMHPKDGVSRPNIMGHNDNPLVDKQCPGKNIEPHLPQIRRDVRAKIEGARAFEVSRALTKPVRVSAPPAFEAKVRVGASSTPIVAIIAIVLLLIRMKEGK
jgi:hypothetical protein